MAEPFSIQLPDSVVIRHAGLIQNDPDSSDRPSVRIVLEMPDYVADALSRMLTDAWQVASIFGGFQNNGLDGEELAHALHTAVTSIRRS